MTNHNNNTDFTEKRFSFIKFLFLLILYIFFDLNKTHKKQKFSALEIVEWQSTEVWSVSCVTCVNTITQVSLTRGSMLLFLNIPTLKLRIIIIILSTEQLDVIFPTARTTKNQVAVDFFNIIWNRLNMWEKCLMSWWKWVSEVTWYWISLGKFEIFKRMILNVNMIIWESSEEGINKSYYTQRHLVWTVSNMDNVRKKYVNIERLFSGDIFALLDLIESVDKEYTENIKKNPDTEFVAIESAISTNIMRKEEISDKSSSVSVPEAWIHILSIQNEDETSTLHQHEPNSAPVTQRTSNQQPFPATQCTSN